MNLDILDQESSLIDCFVLFHVYFGFYPFFFHPIFSDILLLLGMWIG